MDAHDGLTVDEILDSFKINTGVYEKEAVEAAVEHSAEIIPPEFHTPGHELCGG
ncbi:DUF1186 domain-containing protein [Desulfosarcina sp.]|uniref:DUF1186 domain-containing protein n=1 Tax=Desulfosarcina sp. TaxID=2027861 RepID=UPI0029BEA213|nr:DUF1186 domain-containing protein [Desulfosarcina sp.]MDX2453926.1 DUF1186 domain-containing protein [Desulfosarcina sp.]MDX2491620.1 DUF1186 domain-containing protein [Desulfosarcina sp.]